MLFINDENPQILYRSKDGRPGPDRYIFFTRLQTLPRLIFFTVGEAAVQHGDLISEHLIESLYRLGGQGDFRNQNQPTTPLLKAFFQGVYVHFRSEEHTSEL